MGEQKKEPTIEELMKIIEDQGEQLKALREEVEKLKNRPPRIEEHHHHNEGGGGDLVIEYGLPNAPRKHLIIFKNGTVSICDGEELASNRIKQAKPGEIESVWEMKKRTVK
ncbi:MAG: hypothetical protein PHC97_01335 [Patescibacteria group bacterium]|nr:hypothetical protein [Patescibacteria group bacterium]